MLGAYWQACGIKLLADATDAHISTTSPQGWEVRKKLQRAVSASCSLYLLSRLILNSFGARAHGKAILLHAAVFEKAEQFKAQILRSRKNLWHSRPSGIWDEMKGLAESSCSTRFVMRLRASDKHCQPGLTAGPAQLSKEELRQGKGGGGGGGMQDMPRSPQDHARNPSNASALVWSMSCSSSGKPLCSVDYPLAHTRRLRDCWDLDQLVTLRTYSKTSCDKKSGRQ